MKINASREQKSFFLARAFRRFTIGHVESKELKAPKPQLKKRSGLIVTRLGDIDAMATNPHGVKTCDLQKLNSLRADNGEPVIFEDGLPNRVSKHRTSNRGEPAPVHGRKNFAQDVPVESFASEQEWWKIATGKFQR